MAEDLDKAMKILTDEITERVPRCPLCGDPIPGTNVRGYPGARSRYDEDIEICSKCGHIEAALQMNGQELVDPYPYAGIRDPFKQ